MFLCSSKILLRQSRLTEVFVVDIQCFPESKVYCGGLEQPAHIGLFLMERSIKQHCSMHEDGTYCCRVMAGLQARAEADPSFLFKLGCECGLDLAIILTVNLACRREKFLRELDFVLSQVMKTP